jgi:DNA-binding NarL/FixJ family response regulator
VKQHVSRIFWKLKVKDRAEATAVGLKKGLVAFD